MIDWFILLRGIALGLLLALMLAVVLRFRAHYALRLLALFALCLCGYMLAPILHGVTLWFYLAVVFSDATVLLFLLLAQALFDDHRHPTAARSYLVRPTCCTAMSKWRWNTALV